MSPEQSAKAELRAAVHAKQLVVHSVDFDCLICNRSFNFTKAGKLRPAAFVLAHLRSCRIVHGLRTSA